MKATERELVGLEDTMTERRKVCLLDFSVLMRVLSLDFLCGSLPIAWLPL